MSTYTFNPITTVNPGNPQSIEGYQQRCGDATQLDGLVRIAIEFPHSGNSLEIKWENSGTDAAATAAYGIPKVDVSFYQCYWANGCFSVSGQARLAEVKNERIRTANHNSAVLANSPEITALIVMVAIILFILIIAFPTYVYFNKKIWENSKMTRVMRAETDLQIFADERKKTEENGSDLQMKV